MVRLFSFVGHCQTAVQSPLHCFIFQPAVEESVASHPLLAFGVLDVGHSDSCVVVSHFNLHFPYDMWCRGVSLMLLPSVYF